MSDYRVRDQEKWLGKPPWKQDDPALMEWEAAHGHDVRLKCYVEYGCLMIEDALERAEDALDRVRALCSQTEGRYGSVHALAVAIIAALDAGSRFDADTPDDPYDGTEAAERAALDGPGE